MALLLTGVYKSVNKLDSSLVSQQSLWSDVLDFLQPQVGGEVLETWFFPLVFEGMNGRKATVVVPNKFFGEWLTRHYLDLLSEAIQSVGNLQEPVELEFLVRDTNEQGTQNKGSSSSPSIEEPRPLPNRNKKIPLPNPKYTFENFVVGASNQFAHAASRAVAESPALAYNPLFIYGGVGLGKDTSSSFDRQLCRPKWRPANCLCHD